MKKTSTRARKKPAPQTKASASTNPAPSRRTWIVLSALLGMLAFTGALLKALDPGPLSPDASTSLFAIGDQTIDRIFDTDTPLRADHWKYVYIHQSLTRGGDAASLGRSPTGLPDHFVIGNGDGSADGEVQIGHRWAQQIPAGTIAGTEAIKPNCISICMVGDFNHTQPTPTQQARLVQVVKALQQRLRIPPDHVIVLPKRSATAAGSGTMFPASELRAQLLP